MTHHGCTFRARAEVIPRADMEPFAELAPATRFRCLPWACERSADFCGGGRRPFCGGGDHGRRVCLPPLPAAASVSEPPDPWTA